MADRELKIIGTMYYSPNPVKAGKEGNRVQLQPGDKVRGVYVGLLESQKEGYKPSISLKQPDGSIKAVNTYAKLMRFIEQIPLNTEITVTYIGTYPSNKGQPGQDFGVTVHDSAASVASSTAAPATQKAVGGLPF